jgi:phosphonate transport system permease protein
MNEKTRRRNTKPQRRSLVPPLVAALVSVIIPGLGQALAGAVRRGILLLASLISIVGLLLWRINVTARRETGIVAKAQTAFDLETILLLLSIAVIVLYLWIIVDAYLTAKQTKTNSALGLWVLMLVAFFGLGWQIGEIQPVVLVTEAQDAAPFMAQILWPWERAVTRERQEQIGTAIVQVPCSDEPVPEVETDPGAPTLTVDPNCGVLSQTDGTPGSTLTLRGSGYQPGVEVEIWWEDPLGNAFRHRQEGEYLKLTPGEDGTFEKEIIMPYRLIPPSAELEVMYWEVQGRQLAGTGAAQPSDVLLLAIEKMIETIFLGMMATFFGIILSVPISFLAARNLMSASWVTMLIYYLVRTVLNIVRSIEPLIWAVIAIVVVGLGPFAGILALTVHSIAALGKLYSESIESIDRGPIEAIQATGANWLQTIMYAVVPQIIPPFVSFTIYRWDINVRMSTVIGLVGGGGIGFILIQWIRLLDYKAAGIAVWFIAITVAILDYVSAEIRERFV